MELVVATYDLARTFPRSEAFGLKSQLERAIVSIPANIAEGHARFTARDYANFVSIARGSLAEAETYFELAVRLGYANPVAVKSHVSIADEVGRMLLAVRRSLTPRS
jgi:four helix bundle protein